MPRIFFFGGSGSGSGSGSGGGGGGGGGFGCIYYSKLFDGAIWIVWNPQTNILKFDSKSVERYARHAWRLESKELVGKKISSDLAPHFARFQKNNTTIVYLQNRTDWHVAEHFMPFSPKLVLRERLIGCQKFRKNFMQ